MKLVPGEGEVVADQCACNATTACCAPGTITQCLFWVVGGGGGGGERLVLLPYLFLG